MKITNKHGLPESIIRALENDPYDPGSCDISVTKLIDAPLVRQLWIKHGDEVEQDAMDMIWALFGQSVHHILERADNAKVEERNYIDIPGPKKTWKVGGKFDRLSITSDVMTDYKVTSSWSLVYGSRVADWTAQQNCLAHILRDNGTEVKRLEICAILRDWSARDFSRVKNYPDAPMQVIPLEIWPPDYAQAYMADRVQAHQLAEDTMVPCTDDERWKGDKGYVRCKSYCAVSRFCPVLKAE